MMIQWDQTGTDKDSLKEAGWVVMPFNMPIINVSPPQTWQNMFVLVAEEIAGLGELHLSESTTIRTINQEVHDRLLEQSLEEYGDLWSRLAQR